jgi:hypothetical protein
MMQDAEKRRFDLVRVFTLDRSNTRPRSTNMG